MTIEMAKFEAVQKSVKALTARKVKLKERWDQGDWARDEWDRWNKAFGRMAPRFIELCEQQGIEPVVEVDGVKYKVYKDDIFGGHDVDPVDHMPSWIH